MFKNGCCAAVLARGKWYGAYVFVLHNRERSEDDEMVPNRCEDGFYSSLPPAPLRMSLLCTVSVCCGEDDHVWCANSSTFSSNVASRFCICLFVFAEFSVLLDVRSRRATSTLSYVYPDRKFCINDHFVRDVAWMELGCSVFTFLCVSVVFLRFSRRLVPALRRKLGVLRKQLMNS